MTNCNCPLHSLSREELIDVIDCAVNKLNEEIIANGGELPEDHEGYEKLLELMEKRIQKRARK